MQRVSRQPIAANTFPNCFNLFSLSNPFFHLCSSFSGNANWSAFSTRPGDQPPNSHVICNIGFNAKCSDQTRDEYSSDVEKIYRLLRKFHSRVPTLELALQQAGVDVCPPLVERVLNRCGNAGNLGHRFFVWSAKQPGYRHTQAAYKSMIKILGKM